jgi:RloB-like protein
VSKEIAKRRNYYLAMSNPCFELWIWLHLRPNRAFADRHDCQRQLERAWAGYSKGDYDAASLMPFVAIACERATSEDQHPDRQWPLSQATRVYKLVERLR